MHISIAPNVRLFVDIDGLALVPDGPSMREKPTRFLLHGGPGYDHSGFKPAFSRLADVVQIIYYDHRGHGRSDRRPREEWTLDTFADDVVRLCDALGVARPIVLGQSFSGFVAQRYLARHPGHAAKVILSSTSPRMNLERKLAMFERLGGRHAREVAEQFWTAPNEATWARYDLVCNGHHNQLQPATDDAHRRIVFNEEILYASAGGEQQTMDLLPGLAQARCAVLVIAGELDPACPLQDSLGIAAAQPASLVRLATFARSGHGAWRESPKPRSPPCAASSSSRERPAAGGAAGHRASVHAERNVGHRTRP